MINFNNGFAFGASSLDRRADMRTDPVNLTALHTDAATVFIVMWRGKPLITGLQTPHAALLTPQHPLLTERGDTLFLGQSDGVFYFAKDISEWEPENLDTDAMQHFHDQTTQHHPLADPDQDFCELRTVMAQLSPLEGELTAAARSLFDWHRNHGYCARCGHETTPGQAGWQRDCPNCDRAHFPRTDPVVIMLITRGEKVLLGRSPHWPDRMYSLLAGFIEPGETIEAAVRREVFEESGVRVGDVSYLASQPWPYPSSLMIGCHGNATSDAITIDPVEIEDALWITKSELLEVYSGTHPVINPPRQGAIAEFLLRQWLEDRS